MISVCAARVALRNITRLWKVQTRTVREVLDIIVRKQKLQSESCKDKLVESHERAQITRVIGEYLNCAKLVTTCTNWEVHEAIRVRVFGNGKCHLSLLQNYGVPTRTLSYCLKNVSKQLHLTKLKEMQRKMKNRDARREEVKDAIRDLLHRKKTCKAHHSHQGRGGTHGCQSRVGRRAWFSHLSQGAGTSNNILCELHSEKHQRSDKFKRKFSDLEPGTKEPKMKSKRGDIKVAGLSHKRAKQSGPRLAWLMIHKICQMRRDARTRERAQQEAIEKPKCLDLLASVINKLNVATPGNSTMATTTVPPQVPDPPVPAAVRKNYLPRRGKKTLQEVTTAPKDLPELRPRPAPLRRGTAKKLVSIPRANGAGSPAPGSTACPKHLEICTFSVHGSFFNPCGWPIRSSSNCCAQRGGADCWLSLRRP